MSDQIEPITVSFVLSPLVRSSFPGYEEVLSRNDVNEIEYGSSYTDEDPRVKCKVFTTTGS